MTSWQTSLGNNWLGKTEYESKRKSGTVGVKGIIVKQKWERRKQTPQP